MPDDKARVIHCPIEMLQERLNALPDSWNPVLWDFHDEHGQRWVSVVCVRNLPGAGLMVPGNGGLRPR